MLLKDKKVAIIGGGPGGLTLARLLQLKGVDMKVFERDVNKNIRHQGSTLDLHEESGLEAIRRADLIQEFMENHRPNAGRFRIMDKHANILLDEHEVEYDRDETRPEIDRQVLRDILLNSLNPETVVWDSHFLLMERKNEGWLLHFKNGSQVYADFVVAADGANSKIRPYITDIKPVYSNITIIEGNVYDAAVNAPKMWELTNHGAGSVMIMGDNQSLSINTKADGTLSFYSGNVVTENWVSESGIDFSNNKSVAAWFKEQFGSWHPMYQEIFETDHISIVPRPMYHFPFDQTWETLPNLTMLGDAAHRMPPYAGEGVNMAMQDAYELAECLTVNEFKAIKDAVAKYELHMQKRASEITQDTLKNTEMIHSDDAANKMVAMLTGE
ncbi:NAD(P)/FAD-dependent oxidoreductase [Dyadobacter sp. CY356]|uniref:FAD-dependent oxidoreductase n=1 Tax=Dyadobacter sp. CY356 TaxID=2906442 RepID=UPI001F33AA63|nr:NAD(P)/FAD-dependent oxidoreductase [Dyadobacter sp. CY356]MCF0056329.1 FAD-dependent monooxygenase [Dyadobacter sp. CY356]